MKKTIFILVFAVLAVYNVSAQEINWLSFEEAMTLQKKTPKKIMMDVYTNWCGPCKMLERNTFSNADVIDYVNEHFYAVKFNAEGNETISYDGKTFRNPRYKPELANRRNSVHELSGYFRIQGYPTVVFIDENGKLIAPIVGYKKPTDLEFYLKLFKSNDYKELDTKEKLNSYYKAFKPEFRG